MTDAEKIKVFEEKLDVETVRKINDAISKGKDIKIKSKKDGISIYTETITKID